MSSSALPPSRRTASPMSDPGRRQILVLAMACLVHAAWPLRSKAQGARSGLKASVKTGAATAGRVVVGHDPARLPPAVADMRNAILTAVDSGLITDLRDAIDLNELKPDFGEPAGVDPITHLKAISGDGEGREMLAILGRLLDGGFASKPGGRDIENNRMFVWPQFAETGLEGLSPTQEVALYRLVTPEQAKVMRQTGKWTWWRITIGADGVWHSFVRDA